MTSGRSWFRDRYRHFYRLGITPWERYARVSGSSTADVLDRMRPEGPGSPGRALDVGCGRGHYTPELARRGWEAVGIDLVPQAIAAARARPTPGVRYAVGDVTHLAASDLGRFNFFLDVGCFQGLDAEQRVALGHSVTAAAEPGATLLMLAFGPSRWRRLVEGVTTGDVAAAFPGWELVGSEPAATAGLGWPMSQTRPQWHTLRLRDVGR